MTLHIEVSQLVRSLSAKGKTQREISSLIGVSLGYVNRVLTPVRPEPTTLREMLDQAMEDCDARIAAREAAKPRRILAKRQRSYK